ncbi:amidohydrolase family protein [Yeosuana marina]|uniref:amidohydrolase family protein n=1 Tax=Yeosuana marina TaxID=1565536 RepID=UPI0030C7A8C0
MIIDSHQHFWNYNPIRDSWIDDSMGIIKKDFLPKDLHPILSANHVDGCIAVQADQSEEETEFLLQCAKEHLFIKGVVGWVDLKSEQVEERLEHFSKNKLLKGVRHIVQAEADDFMLDSKFMNGISKLERFNLTYDILVFPRQLPAAVELAKAFPNQKFVLDHIAKPRISEVIADDWLNNIQLLAENPNVSCKISGMVTETKDFNWKKRDFTPFLDAVVTAFGMDRLLFGSDWPVCLLAAQYEDILEIIKDYFEAYPTEVIDKVLGGNTTRIYNLKL